MPWVARARPLWSSRWSKGWWTEVQKSTGSVSTSTKRKVARILATAPQCATPLHAFAPHLRRTVLFAPLTCIELRSAAVEDSAIVLSMSLSVNLLAPTIEKVIAKLKTSYLGLLRLFELDFTANGLPAAPLSELQQLMNKMEARDGAW